MTTPDAHFKPPTKPRRRWYQFSLRTLLVGMAIVGFGTAWLGVQVKRALDQRRAVDALAAVADLEFAEPRSWVQRNAWLRAWLCASVDSGRPSSLFQAVGKRRT